MTYESAAVPATTSQLPTALTIFGPPPLLAGEDATAYNDLLARVSGTLKPSDIFEEIWVREITDLIWETLRWRRHQAGLIKAAVPNVLEKILKPLLPKGVPSDGSLRSKLFAEREPLIAASRLAAEWAIGSLPEVEYVEKLLASVGLTMDDVVARAVAHELEKIERFDRLIASAEWRRNTLLREIERRRASFAEKLRREVPKIEEAEFETIKETELTADATHDAVN